MKLHIFLFIVCTIVSMFGDESNMISASKTGVLVQNDSTNVFYYNDDAEVFIETVKGKSLNPIKAAEVQTNRESWPAKDFPEGNWGEIVEGFQISLRFQKQVYTNQETVKAVVLVRNTTNDVLVFFASNKVAPGQIMFLAYDESNQFIPPMPKHSGIQSFSAGGINIVQPGLQRRYTDTLNRTYDLTNGTYWVQAFIEARRMAETNKVSSFEVKSAKVPIKIQ